MAVKNAKNVLKKMFAFVSIAVVMQAMLHIVSLKTNVSFSPYFRLLVFSILVILVARFSLRFFSLAHLALQNVKKDCVIFILVFS